MNRYRLLLVDDHTLFREGLAGILNGQPDMEVVGEASDGLEALVKARSLRPDLILMDVQMPGMDGIEAVRHIHKEIPETTVVMLTVRDDDEQLFTALKAGAAGYILKETGSRALVEMLRAALRGEAALSSAMATRVLGEFRRLSALLPADAASEATSLTDREQEVLLLISRKASDKEIAAQLGISLYTVKSHVRNILGKLQVSSRREAAYLAQKRGLI
ncbi:MAG: response regulator transcription factor [Anaerolineales bacterium]